MARDVMEASPGQGLHREAAGALMALGCLPLPVSPHPGGTPPMTPAQLQSWCSEAISEASCKLDCLVRGLPSQATPIARAFAQYSFAAVVL